MVVKTNFDSVLLLADVMALNKVCSLNCNKCKLIFCLHVEVKAWRQDFHQKKYTRWCVENDFL